MILSNISEFNATEAIRLSAEPLSLMGYAQVLLFGLLLGLFCVFLLWWYAKYLKGKEME